MLYRHLTVLQSDFDRDMMSDDDIHEFTAVNVIQGHSIFTCLSNHIHKSILYSNECHLTHSVADPF